jgi:TRAP transporter TAXI family solute receptor
MKKLFAIILTLALTLGLACGALADGELTFTTGGTAGTYYAYGNVLAQYVAGNSDVAMTAVAGNGSADNIDKLDMEVAQLGFVQNDVAYYAFNGIRIYEGDPVNSFTAIAALYTETVQLITCNPEIKSVADLKGKNVSIGSQGSGVYFNAIDFLNAYDMTEADITPTYQSFADSAEALKDGKIDAAFVCAGAPTPSITELCEAKSGSVSLITIDDEHMSVLLDSCPWYAAITIPAGTYKGVDNDFTTITVKATLVCTADTPDEVAYALVKTIFENKEAITALHEKGSWLSFDFATDGIAVPFAKGAAQYYAEQGITVDTVD